ncbi:hypothetical protein [Microbulbifer sp. HZ11]|uniref:hypothetical protein n=1 Tax=Microbulbifer sp. HZ11 TaxID=1453501 RepID=UPI0005B8E9F2|nr:hypothetical protein [Microbulbifer sp. HZ11]
MRNNSETFDLYNTSPQRALRLVVVIEFPTPVYLASHGDIPGLPGGALGGVLAKVSSTSQRLIPEQGRAEIGAINFELVDVGGVFTDTLRNQLQAGHGIKGCTVRLYQGGAGMDWADFRLEQTQVAEESLGYDHGRYRVRCRDIQREMRKDIFVPRSTRLAADFPKGASTLSVYSTADFEPCPHTASFGDAPGQTVYYLKIKYQNGWEVVRATGKTGSTFTGVTRGLFGTVEYDHTVPTENDDDKGIEVEEFIYLELPAPALAYALLTGQILGTNDVLPSNWQLGIDPAYVVADEFENIGADWYKPGDYTKGVILRFDGLAKTDGKKFIEQEINLLMGAYMPVNAAGQLGYRRMTGVLADAGTVATITADDVVSLGELQQDLAALRNIFSIQWSWYEAPGFDGRFLRSNVLADADSIAHHGESKPQALKFKGLHNSRHTFTTLKNRFDALRDRFAGPPLRLRLSLLPSNNDIEVGDVVRVALPQVRDYTRDPNANVLRWDFASGKDGWSAPGEGTKIITAAAGGVLSVQCLAFDPYILRSLSVSERFVGATVPYAKIRLRRTSTEPVPAGSTFYYRDQETFTYRGVNIDAEVERFNALPVGTWHEIVVDLSGEPEYMGSEINLIRWDIGSNHVADWSYEVDYVHLLPDINLDDKSLDRAMEVQRVSVDQTSGLVQVELFGSTQKAAPITDEAASTNAELPDGWYSAEGTAMAAAGLAIDSSGFLTADGTLDGAASSRTIYYYLGDLTIPAGRTLTVTDNVELRVMGVLQVDGTLRGAPSNSGAGFLGSCRGGAGRAVGKIGPTGWVNTRGEVVTGRNAVMPTIAIDNDGGELLGIPDDLRGSGGARGGHSYHYLRGDNSWEPAGFGGIGGQGGAGVAVVARGIALGVSGKINTSGGNGLPGNDNGPQYSVPAGSGGGGAPGGVLLIIDGHQNPQPVLTNSKMVACYGDSPSSPGNAGAGGKCLGVNAARVYTVPKSRTPYPNYAQDPEISAELQQALDDAAAAQQAAAAAQADATQALGKLDDIGADGKLHPVEKLRVRLIYAQLTGEQAGIDAQADQHGLVLLRGDYDGALAALASYLGGLTPNWDDTSQVTTVSRTLWDANWQAVYDARQALLNAVSDALTTRADNAQTTADNAQAAADNAQGAADDAQATANNASSDAAAALADLSDIAADGKLHPSEKIRANREYNEIVGEQAGIESQATSLGITTAKTNYSNAVAALTSYLQGLSPTWNATNSTTSIVRSTWNTRWQDVYVKRQILLDTISGALKVLADNAQSSATNASNIASAAQASADAAQAAADDAQNDASTALGDLDDIGADGKLHPAEKLPTIREYSAIISEQGGITASATSFGITTEKTAYANAVGALTSYLNGLSPAWDSTTTVTDISRSIWNSNWQAVYDARQALLDRIAEKAGSLADWAEIYGSGKPQDGATVGATAQERLLINSMRNTFLEDFSPSSDWQNVWISNGGGDATVAQYSGGSSQVGGGAAILGDAYDGTEMGRLVPPKDMRVPFDPNKLYRIEFRVYNYNHGDLTRRFYLGVNGFDAAGNLCGTGGADSYGSQHYIAVSGARAEDHLFWETYVAYFKGNAAGNAEYSGLVGGNHIGNPAKLQANVRFFQPTIWNNYQGNGGRMLIDYVKVDVIEVEDQSDLPMVQSDTASVALSAVCTAVDAGSTATINVGAHSVQFGSFTVAYSSGSITGLQFSKKYYVYCDDPGYAGGSVTYYATTNWATARGSTYRRLVDVITTPANGGSGSGGSVLDPGECVCADMWLLDGLQAADARAGDLISVWEPGDQLWYGPIKTTKLVEGIDCVCLVTESGAEVHCSTTAPVTDRDGVVRRAPDTLGTWVGVSHHGSHTVAWERITRVEPIGQRAVCRIKVGGISYAAGVDPAHRIITHNPYYKP